MSIIRRRRNPFAGAPELPDAREFYEQICRGYDARGWEIQPHPSQDDCVLWLEYIHLALQALPTELQPFISDEWSFGPWTPSLIYADKYANKRWEQRHGQIVSEQYGPMIYFSDLDMDDEEDETQFQENRTGHLRPQEPAYITNENVFRYGEQYIDELMAARQWVYPVDENNEFINYLEKWESMDGSIQSFRYEGTWQFVGARHPGMQNDEDFGYWLPEYWRSALGLPKHAIRRRRRRRRSPPTEQTQAATCHYCHQSIQFNEDLGTWITTADNDSICHAPGLLPDSIHYPD